MSDDHTMWSKTLLDGFIAGMKKSPSDDWIKEQAQDLGKRGISVYYLYKVLRKDIDDPTANRFLQIMGKDKPSPAAGGRKKQKRRRAKKKGLLSRLLSSLFGR